MATNKTVKLSFTLDELRELTGIIQAHSAHLRMTACKNGNVHQFDNSIAQENELCSRFYNALIEEEYGKKKSA